MFSKDFFEVLTQILKSWQVLAISVALIIYMYLVSYVARSYRRPRVKRVKIKTKKVKPVLAADPDDMEGDPNDELGLEEE